MRQQAESVRHGRLAAEDHGTRQKSGNTVDSTVSVPAEKPPTCPIRSQIRGLHVCQGGHHFVLPIDKIERALDVKASELPTVQGKAVAHVSGEMCDVVYLAGHLGLMPREDSSANTLMVISQAGTRICLAIDEVLGPVETAVTPMNTVLPKVTGLVGVATLDSGGLALVPDLSRLL
jgi:chemotaxis protein histidine kinase CheA